MRLTIGMATYRDFDGVYFSLNALRLYHADVMPKIELVVVDNDPDGPQGERLRGFLANIADGAGTFYPANQKPVRDFPQPFNVQYVGMPGNTGTSAPRDHIFKVATGDAVLV
ncbi:MAG: glycosyltransferase family 2 protein, partial [Planctomyces sp.]